MAAHSDATGYLLAHRDSVKEAWFHAVCEAAINSDGGNLSPDELERLWRLFCGLETFSPAAATPPVLKANARDAIQPFHLESLSDFSGFKKLGGMLRLDLSKRITLVFGRNGAGKSSICQAFKILANPEKPKEPLNNVRSSSKVLPSFSYKLRGGSVQNWTELDGFGGQAQALKYFDSAVAYKHVNSSISPEAVVELSAFRLECFDYAREYLKQFQAYGGSKIAEYRQDADRKIAEIKLAAHAVIDTNTGVFKDWSATNCEPMLSWIGTVNFGEEKRLQKAEKQARIEQLKGATSAEGQQALTLRKSLLGQVKQSLANFVQQCGGFSYSAYTQILLSIQQKQAASIELAGAVFSKDLDVAGQQKLLSAAAALRPFVPAENCPLCRQTLENDAKALFLAFHNHLISTVQTELNALNTKQQAEHSKKRMIEGFAEINYSQYSNVLNADFLHAASDLITSVKASLQAPLIDQAALDAYSRYAELNAYIEAVNTEYNKADSALTLASNGLQALNEEISKLTTEIGVLSIDETASSVRPQIEPICQNAISFAGVANVVESYNFTSRLSALTARKKDAHTALVLGSFVPYLDGEYRRLCGASLEQIGVRLANQGADAIVLPKIGDELVHRVLSEGELKVHALALFMCEASVAPHQVLILDDPVTSFDYNYISNFCERLRDYAKDNAQSQLIVLTHNWDFFANLQNTLNGSGLSGAFSVQVLEDCATVSEYVEKWEELCGQIDTYIGPQVEISPDEKSKLSALLRRLVERLTNSYVFNEQRHQYKIRTLQVSNFKDFVKLVPLLPAEADRLKDLYANLSPLEHDDVRNYYSTKSIYQFGTWYDEIKSIKNAVEGRRT
ncbi:AAA family ATPase [Pseudomonas sp. B21-010]|uniref:AAA family ATPase n=1 Tax=Pseudomonas sp. B21-010 TaxID=2895471 RepID=UPI0021600771|nr:AAA family ATPase [Pseudomonas sp. B21-010]UVM59116.1 AAA family ATPase [Pseudomonas sp. B21-010]